MGYTDPGYEVEREIAVPINCGATVIPFKYVFGRKVIITAIQTVVTTVFNGDAIILAQVGSTTKATCATIAHQAAVGAWAAGTLATDPSVAATDTFELEVTDAATSGACIVTVRYKDNF